MSRIALKERVRKRLATIEATKDEGVYAKHYAEDVASLLAALEEDEGLIDRLAKASGRDHEEEDDG